jgi:membrane protease YdiL (CAAX protease family)
MKTADKLLAFLKAPKNTENYNDIEAKDFFLLLLITFLIIVPYAFILVLAGIDQFDHKLEVLLKENKWLVAVLAIFLAPLIEETVYRLHLDFKKASIWWSLGLSLLMIGEVWIPVTLLWVYLLFLMYKVNSGETPNLKYCIYISSGLFALVHLTNFTDFDYGKYFYWVPFLVGAQFIIGLVLSYIRLNHGIKWAMIFHGVYNAVLIIPAIYFYEP